MRFRFPFVLLGLLAIPAAAQTSDKPAIVPALPAASTMRNDGRQHTFLLRLKYVKPSLMAFWLDPKNHEVPHYAAGRDGAVLNLSLPSSVTRVVAVDPQKALLAFGTFEGVAEMSRTIKAVDEAEGDLLWTPKGEVLVLSPAANPITFVISIYWLDSLAAETRTFIAGAATPHVETKAQWDALQEFTRLGRAKLGVLSPRVAVCENVQTFTLAPSTDAKGNPYASLVPELRTAEGAVIDSGFIPPSPETIPELRANQLRLTAPWGFVTALSNRGAGSEALVERPGAAPVSLLMYTGDSLLLSGEAPQFGFAPPSPRFGSFVVRITAHFHPASGPLLMPAMPAPCFGSFVVSIPAHFHPASGPSLVPANPAP